MKKTFIKSKMNNIHEFMKPYDDVFYIEDVLSDSNVDINMKVMFMINECDLSNEQLKLFVIGYSKLMPDDKLILEAIHSSELYMQDRITAQELQRVPNHILQTIISNGMNFDSLPKLPMLLYTMHLEDQMFRSYIHLICSSCSYYLQHDSDKVTQYFKDFVSSN